MAAQDAPAMKTSHRPRCMYGPHEDHGKRGEPPQAPLFPGPFNATLRCIPMK